MTTQRQADGTRNGTQVCERCSMRGCSIFASLGGDALHELDGHVLVTSYQRGEPVFLEGSRPTHVHCISKGRLKLFKSGTSGKTQIVRMAKSGDLLGYRSFLSGEPHRATAEALEEVTVCRMECGPFMDFVTRHPATLIQLVKRMAVELGQAEERILDAVDRPALARLARLLLRLGTIFQTNGTPGEIALTREEVGEMIGTTPETTIRLLTALKRQGVLGLGKRRINILQPQALERLKELSW